MATSGSTVVKIRKTNFTTRVNKFPVFSLDYVAGDARQDINLTSINSQYLNKVKDQDNNPLQDGRTYLVNWKFIGVRKFEGKTQDRYAMEFSFVNTSDPIELAMKIKKFKEVFGDNAQVEESYRAQFRKNGQPAIAVTNAVVDEEETDFN
jgi:hypothetical protein